MTNTVLPPTVRSSEDGEQRWFFGGGIHTWKVTSAESGGAFMLFEDAMDEGKATPLHLHPESDETMYVLEGEILMHLDGNDHRVGPGGLAVAPRGVPHAFMVLSKQVRMLCLHTPGSCDALLPRRERAPCRRDPRGGSGDRSLGRAGVGAAESPASSCWDRPHSSEPDSGVAQIDSVRAPSRSISRAFSR